MLKIIATATAFLISLITFSQVSENRNVASFSKLKASHGIEVLYTVSGTSSLKVETDDNEKMKFIKTEVEDSTLKIFVDSGDRNYSGTQKRKGKRTVNGIHFNVLKVIVSGPSLQTFKASSSANIKIQNTNATNNVAIEVSSSGSVSGKFNCDKIDVDASSSGDFEGDIDAKMVAVESSSSADVHLSGKTEKLKVKSSSSSSCNADKLTADDVVATASSSADINLYVMKSLDAKASSSADINYKGNPSQVTKDQSSSGSVNKR